MKYPILEIWKNPCLLCAVSAWFLCQITKGTISSCKSHKWKISNFTGSGGMPSSHTGAVVALALSAGSRTGFDTPLFAVCFIFAAVVIYDAAGVRHEADKQGIIIRELLNDDLTERKQSLSDSLKEKIGHTPLEIAAGAVMGIVCFCLFLLW